MLTTLERFENLITEVKNEIAQHDIGDGEDRSDPETAYVHGLQTALDIIERHANRLR